MKLSKPLKCVWFITVPFGVKLWYGTHKGIDLRTRCNAYPDGNGTPFYAPADGEVMYFRRTLNAGNTLAINHGDGYVTKYMHLKDSYFKSAGEAVREGVMLGACDSDGLFCKGAHLHFQLEKDGVPIDPVPYFKVLNTSEKDEEDILKDLNMTYEELKEKLKKEFVTKDVRVNFDPKDGSVWIINHGKRYKVGTSDDDIAVVFSKIAGEHISDEERDYPITKDRREVLS